MTRLYIVYDARAMYDVDAATVFTTADTLHEARRDAKGYGGGVIYSYKKNGQILDDERFEQVIV